MNLNAPRSRKYANRPPLAPLNGFYNQAKRYEYTQRNLPKAIEYYSLAIRSGDKVDSAIKDLAAVLHQTGSTKQAVEFLESHRGIYRGDLEKYDNLIINLAKQISAPSGKNLNKSLLIVGVPHSASDVRSLFTNCSRIIDVRFYTDLSFTEEADEDRWDELGRWDHCCYCLVSFMSYSAAKKTLDTLRLGEFPQTHVYWVNVNKLIVCEATCDESLASSNSYYHGFMWFGSQVTVEDYKDLASSEKLQEIQNIWKSGQQYQSQKSLYGYEKNNLRLRMENEAKMDMLRKRKYRYPLL